MSAGQQTSSAITDLMSPLLMIILLEKLVEFQMEDDGSKATNTETAAASDYFCPQQLLKAQRPFRPPCRRGLSARNYHKGHNGLDFGIVVGTPVKTTMDGKVVHAGWNNQGYGNLVIVQNGDYKTYYAHLSSIPVSVGDSVTAGTTIGLSGNTGNSTGPHLHYEIRKNNVAIDPTSATLGS
jgi:murein DD-endopeptidase MepM/ murein hydrolase activator NlpD